MPSQSADGEDRLEVVVADGGVSQILPATSSTCRLNPRVLSRIASSDVASNVCQALVGGHGEVEGTPAVKRGRGRPPNKNKLGKTPDDALRKTPAPAKTPKPPKAPKTEPTPSSRQRLPRGGGGGGGGGDSQGKAWYLADIARHVIDTHCEPRSLSEMVSSDVVLLATSSNAL